MLTAYTKLDINTEIGSVLVRGNLGLQIIHADQSASGFSTVTANSAGFVEATPVSGGADYTDVLPSFNLSAEVAERQFVRTAISKVISRPRMDQMRPNNQVSFLFIDNNILEEENPVNGPWSGSTGNPELRPLEANQFDLAYENYFADDGYIAASFFFKDIKNWHFPGRTIADFSDVYIPDYHLTSDGVSGPVLFNGPVDFTDEASEGFVRGYELQGSLPLDVIHESLKGFGVVASATFMNSKLKDENGNTFRVPGLSDEIYNLTAFYEYAGLELRVAVTKRSDFNTETRGTSLALAPTVDQGGKQVDAQIGYDFAESGIAGLEGLRITLQGQNLSDEPTIQANPGDSRQVTQYQSYGRNFLLGFNYSF
jgi:iron complex outermembrane receptor protein